jgi:hypothetical protein
MILGDSIQNILGDLFSCGLGYVLGTLFAAVELWWISLVWVLVSEVAIFIELQRNTCLHISTFLDCMHSLHARQLASEYGHPPGPQREADALAVLQGPRY